MTEISAALASDRPQVLASIVAGFVGDPVTRWCWPEAESYFRNSPKFFDAYGGKAFDLGSAWVDEEKRGGALWLPPGEGPDEETLGQVVTSTLPEEKQRYIFSALEQLGSYHPKEPHWFLPIIAVDPLTQGQGIGSQLMQHAVSKCDEAGTRAYLESSNPRNIPLYERHGFRVLGEVKVGSCPVFTPMIREPR